MAKRGVTSFSATQVAKQGLAVSTAVLKMADLEKEVSRLRHHVSVLSRRNHGLQKELDGLRVVGEGVASSKEPEPQVVAEPPEPDVVSEVAPSVASDDVMSVASVLTEAKPAVAESRLALEMMEQEVAVVRLPKGKRRRVVGDEEAREEEGSEAEEVVEGIIVATSIPRGPRGFVAGTPGGRGRGSGYVAGAPVGPRSGYFGRGVVNPNFPMFFNHSRGFPGDREKWPAGRGRGYR